MKLSDVMSAAGLSGYAIVALVLFMLVFLAIVIRTFAPGSAARHARDARLPLDDDEPGPARRTGKGS
ncbi:MAG: cbb3-type cytochrome c oxidase subunit 3 [Gemmatimonadota bacterium]|nr:cbb3-type cytochrome c oxidase subunit 3 [Gemmatimonadota bacterium]